MYSIKNLDVNACFCANTNDHQRGTPELGLSAMAPAYSPQYRTDYKKQTPCRFFQLGACRNGKECPFSHEIGSDFPISLRNNPKDPNPVPETYYVEDGIQCRFGPGATVTELLLGDTQQENRKKSVIISGLKSTISEYDVEVRLSAFGTLMRLSMLPWASVASRSSFRTALAIFSDAKAAISCVQALHGTSVKSWEATGNCSHSTDDQRVSVIRQDSKDLSSNSVSGATVKVQWYASARCAWAHYSQLFQAQKAQAVCHGKMFGGRVLSVKFQTPSRNQQTSFSIWIGNLAEEVSEKALKKFLERNAKFHVLSVSLGELPFTEKSGPILVQKLLTRHGPLVLFETSNSNHSGLKRKGLAIFLNEKDATRACEYFASNDKVMELGGSKLFVQRVFTLKYKLPSLVFGIIHAEMDAKIKTVASVRYSFFDGGVLTTVAIQADDKLTLVEVKSKIDPILIGEVVKDNEKGSCALWTRYIASSHFVDEIQRRDSELLSCIWCDKQRGRLFGSRQQRKRAEELVQTLCAEAKLRTYAVPIARNEFHFILQNGRTILDKLTRATKCRKISLDLKNCSLLVEGNIQDSVKVLSCISKMVHGKIGDINTQGHDSKMCPICFCSPGDGSASENSVIHLSCGHSYCRECLESWLSGTNTCDFPLMCLADGCTAAVEMNDLFQCLHGDFLNRLLRSAVDDHVRKSDSLHFCTLPTCPGIYSTATQEGSNAIEAECSTCSICVCISCKVNHSGQTCSEYKLAVLPPDRIRMHIIDEILTLRCPRCHQAFLDFDGCFALSCGVCPCHFCGWCLEDCGANAHPHVKTCRFKENGSETYFGTKEQFDAANRKRRQKNLSEYFASLSPDEKLHALESVENDLRDIGLDIVRIS
jgi:hypothetical protein